MCVCVCVCVRKPKYNVFLKIVGSKNLVLYYFIFLFEFL